VVRRQALQWYKGRLGSGTKAGSSGTKAGSSGTKAGWAVVQRQAGQWHKGRQAGSSGTKAGRQAAVVQRQAGRQQWYKACSLWICTKLQLLAEAEPSTAVLLCVALRSQHIGQ